VNDELLLGILLLSFAIFATTHVVVAGRLMWRVKPRYRGLIALLVPPLALVWAFRQKWRVLCWTWLGSVLAYAVVRLIIAL